MREEGSGRVGHDAPVRRARVSTLTQECMGEVARVPREGGITHPERFEVDRDPGARRQNHLRVVVGQPAAHQDAQRIRHVARPLAADLPEEMPNSRLLSAGNVRTFVLISFSIRTVPRPLNGELELTVGVVEYRAKTESA